MNGDERDLIDIGKSTVLSPDDESDSDSHKCKTGGEGGEASDLAEEGCNGSSQLYRYYNRGWYYYDHANGGTVIPIPDRWHRADSPDALGKSIMAWLNTMVQETYVFDRIELHGGDVNLGNAVYSVHYRILAAPNNIWGVPQGYVSIRSFNGLSQHISQDPFVLDLDGNADGVIDAKDDRFADLRVWQDANGDDVSQADELQSLTDAGIAIISLEHGAANPQQGTLT